MLKVSGCVCCTTTMFIKYTWRTQIVYYAAIYTVSKDVPLPFYILNNCKNEPILIFLVYRIMKKFHIRLVETCPPHLNNVAALPYEKQLF